MSPPHKVATTPHWAFVGLKSGLLVSYSGKGGYPATFSARARPWYALGRDASSPRWGNPYIDLQGQGLLLPCVAPVVDADGGQVGVAAIEVTFNDLINNHLQPSEAKGFVQAYLLDAEGHVVVQTDDLLADTREMGTLHDARRLVRFYEPAVMSASRATPSGVIETTHRGQPLLLGFQNLSILGWVFVEAFQPTGALAQP